jgi:hypothetical protein
MEKNKHLTLSEIRKAAVDAQAYRACQYLQALAIAIEHKKAELGYPGELSYDKEAESNAAGMLETAIGSLADDPPIPLRQCVVNCDSAEQLSPTDLDSLVVLVGNDCEEMFGGSSGD